MMDTLRILVSGIADDMLPERDALARAVMSLRVKATRVELEFANELATREDALQRVYACGIYLGVYDRTRYGRLIPTESISVTELEFNRARELEKPTLIFVKKAKEIERASSRQEEFIERVVNSATGNFGFFDFDDPDQLATLVASALRELIVERFYLQVTQPPFLVPLPLDTFVGRESVLAQVARALAPGKPVVIHGLSDIGGLGKTELAIRVAHQLRDTFSDGVLWANIPTLRPAETLANWARAYGGLGVLGRGDLRFVFRPLSLEARRVEEVSVRIDALREQLRGKRVLAILDGVVDERDNEKIAPLVNALENCVVIITSRTPRLPALESFTAIELPRMSVDEAGELFARIVGDERLADERAALTTIGDAVDFLPLAFDLAARQLRENDTWTLDTLAEILKNERHRLEATRWGYSTARGLQAAMNVSYHNLSADEKIFFTVLGAFAGEDFDVSAAAFVADTPREQTRQLLARFTRLALAQERRRRGRYALHPGLRLFARDKWEDSSPDARMARYYCALATEEGRKLQTQELHSALVTLDVELSNIFAGHRWTQTRNERLAWELCRDYVYGAMIYYFNLKAMWSDWIAWSSAGIEACQKLGDERSASSIAGSLGMVYYRRGELDQASEFYREALVIMEKLGHFSGLATIHMNLGNVQTEKGEWQDAIESHAKSLQLRERLGDLHGLAQTRANLGALYAKYGDKNKARANWTQALELFVHIGAEHEADIVRKWLKGLR